MAKAVGCIFIDTNTSCLYVRDGSCVALGSVKLECLFNHSHTVVDRKMVNLLHHLLDLEIDRASRTKHMSGLAGRKDKF